MREIVYKCKKPFVGSAVIELPKYTQRLKYVKECNFKINDDGDVDVGVEQMDSVIKMVEIAKEHVKKVDIKFKEIHAKSFDELEDYQEFDPIIPEIATLVLNGGRLGNG